MAESNYPTRPVSFHPKIEKDIASAINRHSGENVSNTPDFILAEFLTTCLGALDIAVKERDRWYDVSLSPGCVRILKWQNYEITIDEDGRIFKRHVGDPIEARTFIAKL